MKRWYPQLAQTLFAWATSPLLLEEQHFSSETELHYPDGTTDLVLLSATAHIKDGTLDRVDGVVYELSAMESQRISSIETEQRYQMLFRDAPNGLIQAAPDKRIILVNPAFCKLLGYVPEELLEMTTEDITHPDDRCISAEAVRRLWDGEVNHCSYEKRYIRKDGSPIWTQLGLSLFRGVDGTPLNFIGQCQDISERKAREEVLQRQIALQVKERAVLESQAEHLRDLAHKDPLTLLWNRSAFDNSLKQLTASALPHRSYGVISIEIGGLSLRNRNHGEEAVDELLRSSADALRRACRSSACIARLSGGNFRVLFQAEQESDFRESLDKITSELARVRWRNGPLSPKVWGAFYEAGPMSSK